MRNYMRDRLMRDSRRGVKGTGRYGIGGRDHGYREFSMDYHDREPDEYDYAYSGRRDSRGGRGSQRDRQSYGRDYRRDYGRYDMRYDDYESDADFEYNYDMHEKPLELSKDEIRKWSEEVKNSDGSRGAKFGKEQIIPMARQIGIEFGEDKFTEEEFVMAVNMMYSDYCSALKEAGVQNYHRPEPYVFLAKAFLVDKDFEGKPYEKLALYYYDIVEYED